MQTVEVLCFIIIALLIVFATTAFVGFMVVHEKLHDVQSNIESLYWNNRQPFDDFTPYPGG